RSQLHAATPLRPLPASFWRLEPSLLFPPGPRRAQSSSCEPCVHTNSWRRTYANIRRDSRECRRTRVCKARETRERRQSRASQAPRAVNPGASPVTRDMSWERREKGEANGAPRAPSSGARHAKRRQPVSRDKEASEASRVGAGDGG